MSDIETTPSQSTPRPPHLLGHGDLAERLGVRIVSLSPQECVATMPVAGNTQPYGLLHGGASAALAETVGSFAANAHAQQRHPGGNAHAVGLELSITHHRGARDGIVTATARAQHLGRTTATYLVELTVRPEGSDAADGDERLISSARLTCLLLSD